MLSFLYWLFRDALFFFGMLSGRSSFPKPLTREEEAAAVAAMRQGDEGAPGSGLSSTICAWFPTLYINTPCRATHRTIWFPWAHWG